MLKEATYLDGDSARSVDAWVRIEGPDLVILDEDGNVVARWLAEDVRLVDDPRMVPTPRLRCGFDRRDRLRLASVGDLHRLSVHLPNLKKSTPPLGKTLVPIALWGSAAVVSILALFFIVIPLVANQATGLITENIARNIGEETEKQLIYALRRMGKSAKRPDAKTRPMICDRMEGQRALESLAKRLAQGLPDLPQPIITVIDHEMPNAAALPGWRILVMRGLIDKSKNAEELAGVLAHELAHTHYRHALELALRSAGSAALLSVILGDISGGAVIASVGEWSLRSAYGRDAEREADLLGVEIMNKADIDARGLGEFLQRLTDEFGELPPEWAWLSTHPSSDERAQVIAQKSTGKRPALTEAEWAAVRSMCE